MKAIVVDDEPKALDALTWQLKNFCPHVQVVAACSSVTEAWEQINKLAPDLVFLDIEMPVQNGFELLSKFTTIPFEVIFTTAYDQFAIKAIKFSALDYLLKPIDPNELQAAVAKAEQRQRRPFGKINADVARHNYQVQQNQASRFALPTSEGILFVEAEQIIRCESESNYTRIFLADGQKPLLAKTLKDVELLLEGYNFFRVHNSHLINITHIKKLSKKDGGVLLMQDDAEITIARNRKDQFLELFRKF